MARILPDTKFFVPRPRESLVGRPRLSERLSRATRAKLTLISAPPGFGKTTLLAEWLASLSSGEAVPVWVSLDTTDNEAGAFWFSVATAFQRAVPTAGKTVSMVEGPQPPPIETVVTTFANELGSVGSEVVLVLDDFHVIDVSDVQDQLSFLLENLPASAHVVITTRADPTFPLARLRAQRQLVEVRATDLRFTHEEAAVYLNQEANLNLDARQVASLEERTEGWIAALQLAALSLQGRDDVDGFISGFAGDDRFVVDYLVEEVLLRQPVDVRRFLMSTCVLDRITGALCDALTGQDDGQAMLEVLDRRNLFLIPLDVRREWYRYHHLFAEVLRSRLTREEPARVYELHRRASAWYEQRGERSDAIWHALAAQDYARAADMIELAIPDLSRRREEATLQRWFELLPDQVYELRPVLTVGYVGVLMAHGALADVELLLQRAERWLRPPAGSAGGSPALPGAMIVVDEAEFGRLPSAVALYRAAQARLEGDRERTEAFALRALDLAGDEDPLGRGGAAGFLGFAHWGRGDLEAAHGYWTEAMGCLQRAGNAIDAIGCYRPLAEIRFAQGRLHEALTTYEQGLRTATDNGTTFLRGTGDMHVGMSELCLEWNDLDAAVDHLQKSDELGDQAGFAQNPYRWRVAMAQVCLSEGNGVGALALLQDAERVFVSEYYPLIRPIPSQAARIHAAQGRLPEAGAWALERGLTVDDDLDYVHEYEHITLARVLLAQGTRTHDPRPIQQAITLLERLLTAAEAGGRWRSVIEILVLQALTRHDRASGPTTLEPLSRALSLAEAEGYVRVFLAEGAPMAAMLASASRRGIAPAYVRQLLDATETGGGAAMNQRLVEPLSERELAVLRLLASDLDGPGIAHELVVALSTVRTHTKGIYAKLAVNSRRAAVRRGEELGLLPEGRDR